ncbi:hypothetical protein [Streptacidiphilus sp. EB129]|uniref:hypothetical protein n=1 Tax=Streptacidiphilus sp. EB129 TaxID=3156262 RepID=UPI003510FE11
MPSTARRLGATLAATAVLTGGLVAGATAASAKSNLAVGVRSHSVAHYGSIQVTAAGATDDFGGAPIQLCIDERVNGGGWTQLSCASAGHLAVTVKATRRGTAEFRAQLIGLVGSHHRRTVDRTSAPVSVHVR